MFMLSVCASVVPVVSFYFLFLSVAWFDCDLLAFVMVSIFGGISALILDNKDSSTVMMRKKTRRTSRKLNIQRERKTPAHKNVSSKTPHKTIHTALMVNTPQFPSFGKATNTMERTFLSFLSLFLDPSARTAIINTKLKRVAGVQKLTADTGGDAAIPLMPLLLYPQYPTANKYFTIAQALSFKNCSSSFTGPRCG